MESSASPTLNMKKLFMNRLGGWNLQTEYITRVTKLPEEKVALQKDYDQ